LKPGWSGTVQKESGLSGFLAKQDKLLKIRKARNLQFGFPDPMIKML